MKKITMTVVGVTLLCAMSTFAQPLPGKWTTVHGDFAPGSWAEILPTGQEGAPGNEITAFSEGTFDFRGALLERVELVREPDPPRLLYYEYLTLYLGGTLTLANLPGQPWYNPRDPATRFPAAVRGAKVRTRKYVDVDGEETGETSFRLDTMARFVNSPGHSAQVTAGFRGVPDIGGTGEPDDPIFTTGDLGGVEMAINGRMAVDIKPGSCPNPLNCKSRGYLPVAILGGPGMDVRRIDPRSVQLEGVGTWRYAYEDVATPHRPTSPGPDPEDCNELGPDGHMDLVLHFWTPLVCRAIQPVEPGEVRALRVSALLRESGVMVEGSDLVVIRPKRPPKWDHDDDSDSSDVIDDREDRIEKAKYRNRQPIR